MVGIYVRVSTEEQAVNGFSIRAQLEKLLSFCKLKDWEVFDKYIDDGISGKSVSNRKELLRLIDDIKDKKVNNVLVYKIDRLTRSTKDLIELVDFFNAYNCSFNSFTENIDTYSSTGRMFIKIIGIFAEFERENISERVRFGLERKVKEGYTIASKNISYGYYKNKNENVQLINQYEAYVVRKIFNLYIYGCSFSNIANYLNKFHVKRKNGIWNYKNVKLILSNPNYVGMVRHGIGTDAYFECLGNHEKIIPDELYNNVKYKIQDHSSFICVCGNKYVKKRTFYYSKKCKRISKYSRLYCKRCKTSLNLNKVYLKMKTSKTMGNIMVDENYNILEV